MKLIHLSTIVIDIHAGVGFQRSDAALQAEVRSLFEQDSSYVLFQAARLGDETIIKEFLSKFRNEVQIIMIYSNS